MENIRQVSHEDYIEILRPMSIGIQVSGLTLLLGAWYFADVHYTYNPKTFFLIFILVTACIILCVFTRHLSVFTIATTWAIDIGFSILVQESQYRLLWAFTLCIAGTFIAAPVFSRYGHYLVAIAGIWLIFGRGDIINPTGDQDVIWVWMMIFTSVSLGSFLNIAFSSINRKNLALRDSYKNMAYNDALTGIANRRKLVGDFQQLHAKGALTNGFFIMVDIDNFKNINDDFGHPVGDSALTKVANAIRLAVNENPFGRLGGEEFGVVVLSGGIAQARTLAQNILEGVRRININGRAVTVSLGISRSGAEAGPSEMMHDADDALYEAKRSGKDKFILKAKNF